MEEEKKYTFVVCDRDLTEEITFEIGEQSINKKHEYEELFLLDFYIKDSVEKLKKAGIDPIHIRIIIWEKNEIYTLVNFKESRKRALKSFYENQKKNQNKEEAQKD